MTPAPATVKQWPSVLLGTQAAWINDPEPLKVLEKGRRTGGSWGEAADDVLIAASSKAAGGQNVYYIPQTKEDAVEFIETCAKWAKAFDYAVSEIEERTYEDESDIWGADDADRSIKTYVIRFDSGFRIVALSSAPARIRGKQGVVVIDEAAYQPALEGLLKSALALLLRGGRVRVISTHDGDENPFNKLINEIRHGDRRGKIYSYPFRKAVGEGMYRRICEMEGDEWSQAKEDDWVETAYAYYGDDAQEELDCIPSSGEGTYLPTILIERAMVDVPVLRLAYKDSFSLKSDAERRALCGEWITDTLDPLLDDEALNPHFEHVYGMDFARYGDLSVIAPATIQQNLVRRTPFILELRNCPTRQQEQILWHIIDRLPRLVSGAMDATGNGETLAEYTMDKFGGRIDPVKLNDKWYGAHMPELKEAFEDNLIQIPRDADVRRDLKKIKKQKGIPKLDPSGSYAGSDGNQRHGDTAIALALMIYASLRDVAPIEFQSTGDRGIGETLDRDFLETGGAGEKDTGWGSVGGGNDFGGFL